MITRRDTLRLMTATAAARHLPFALSQAEASAKLDEPVPFDAGIAAPTLDYTGYPMPSPTAFAEDLRQVMDLDSFGWFVDGAPEQCAAYRKALQAVADVAPGLLPMHGVGLMSELEDAVMNLALASWNAGVGVGAEIEHLRQALLRPVQLCHRCHGSGREEFLSPISTPDIQPDDPPRICTTCKGPGIVPTTAV